MEDVSNIADLWSCLPYTEEGFSFEFQYYFYHLLEYCKIVRMQSQIYCTFFTKVSWRNRRFEKAGVAVQVR